LKFKDYISGLIGRKVTVIGAGISNTPLIEALLGVGVDTTVCDMRTRDEMGELAHKFESLGAKLKLGADYLKDLDADVIFRTPGLMPFVPEIATAVKNGAVLTSEMEAFFEVCPCPKIGITGSDGKTTTTSIIAELLRNEGLTVHCGGNIGNPLLCTADEISPDDIAVLELSSFQLISMRKCPEIAVVTNLSPNHLDVHTDMEEYVEAKQNIYIRQNSNEKVVLNLDYEITRDYAKLAKSKVYFFSRREVVTDGYYEQGGTIYEASGGVSQAVMQVSDILLPGEHNIENILAAFTAVQGLVSHDTMRKTAETFGGVAHRIELVRELKGVRYYNDSIASSPSRTIAGLRSFSDKVILIAGGKDKGIAFDDLGVEIVSRVKKLVLTGLTAERIRDAVESAPGYAGQIEIIMKDDFKDAVCAASEVATKGDVVILSPACTSFDRFRNFEERGNLFKEIVNSLD